MNDPQQDVPNPLEALRRGQRVLWLMAVPILASCLWWLLRPLSPLAIDLLLESPEIGSAPATEPASDPEPAIDSTVFATNLWSIPPASEQTQQAAAQAPPPPPPNIQLIGIITDVQNNDQIIQKAAFYDLDRDRILIVADGDRVRDHRVRVLAGGIVELFDGQTTRRLALRPDAVGKGTGGVSGGSE